MSTERSAALWQSNILQAQRFSQWYPPERGEFSIDFLEQLQADAPHLPLWPDAENASNAAAADRLPTERFAFMPEWLGLGYWLRGRHGYWDPHVTGNIAQQVSELSWGLV